MIDWEAVVAIGLALPGIELGTSYGRPALKLHGKMIAAGGKAEGYFVLSATLDEIEMLKDTGPDCFFIERAWLRGPSKAPRAARG